MERGLFRLNAKGMVTVIHVPGNCYLSFLYLYWKHCYMYNQNAHLKLQRLVGKCVSFSLVIPGAQLFTEKMNAAISKGHLSSKLIRVCGALREEICDWSFLKTWDERHVRVSDAPDASNFASGGSLISPVSADTSDYWTNEERSWNIATKEATGLSKSVEEFPGGCFG